LNNIVLEGVFVIDYAKQRIKIAGEEIFPLIDTGCGMSIPNDIFSVN